MNQKKRKKSKILALLLVMMLMLASVVIVNMPVVQAAGNDFYVRAGAAGTNDGSDWDNAWNSFSYINWALVDPGSTIWVAGGTYGNLVVNKSGTEGNPITVKRATVPLHGADAGWNAGYDDRVIIDGGGAWTAISIGDTARADYITIDGAAKYGIWVRNAMFGIRPMAAPGYDMHNLTVRYMEFGDSGIYKLGEDGIQGQGNNLLVEYCYIHDNDIIETHGDGIQWFHGNGLTIRYNLFKNNGQTMMNGVIEWNAYVNDLDFYGNIVYNTGGNHYNGIRMNIDSPQAGHYVNVYNNVFDLRVNPGGFDSPISGSGMSADRVSFVNNAVLSADCGSISDTTHYNNAYVDSGIYKCSNIPYELSMVVNDDLGFINMEAADYHPAGSSLLRNAGADTGFTMDFDGNPVANPPCIGSFQYMGDDPAPTPKPAPTPPPTPDPDAWYSRTNFAQVQGLGADNTGIVTMEFDVTALQNLSTFGGLVGYAGVPVTIKAYSSMPLIIRMNPDGSFDVRNGGDYMALTEVPYNVGTPYHVKVIANLPAKTYDVWVTADSTEYKIADDYAFRSDAPVPAEIGKVCLMTEGGNNQFMIRNHTVSSISASPMPTPVPTPKPTLIPKPAPAHDMVFSLEGVNLAGSSKIIGNTGTNSVAAGSVNFAWSTGIEGDLFIGPGVDWTKVIKSAGPDPLGNVTGSISNLGSAREYPMPLFPETPSLESKGDLTAGWWPQGPHIIEQSGAYGKINVTGQLTVNVGDEDVQISADYLTVSGSGSITVNRSGAGKLVLYVARQMELTGSGNINKNGGNNDVVIYYSGSNALNFGGSTRLTASIFARDSSMAMSGSAIVKGNMTAGGGALTVSGNAEADAGVLYAPNAAAAISGNGKIKGAVVARSMQLSGNARMILGSTTNTDFFKRLNWGIILPSSEQTLFTTQHPDGYDNDGRYELGTIFKTTAAGTITKVRIYANAAEGGIHNIRIWRVSDGALMAGPYEWDITAGAEGWKTFILPVELSISADTDYIVSVSNSTDKWYPYASGGFSSPINNGNLVTYTGSGTFSETPGVMPTSVWGNSNYFRDVVFVP